MANQRGVIAATILAALITAGVALYINHDQKKEHGYKTTDAINTEAPKEKEDGKTPPKPILNFAEIFVTPIDTEISSTIYAEILNSGSKSANDFYLCIDFGEARPEKCEIISGTGYEAQSNENLSIKRWKIHELPVHQSVYVVCNTNSPIFKKISVGGGNLENDKQLAFSSYIEQKKGASISFYEGLFRFILGTLSAILLLYIFLSLMRRLG